MNDLRFNNLFRKLLNRTATAADRKELHQLWEEDALRRDPEQLFPYEDWQQTSAKGSLTERLQQNTLRYVLEGDARPDKAARKISARLRWLPAAAAAVLLMVIAGYRLLHTTVKENTLLVVSTAPGEQKMIRLADGSVVHLNGGSSMHFPGKFEGRQRMVRLHGEAFFEIRSASAQPFIVQTGNVATTVLGTSFNIIAGRDATAVTVSVKTGQVLVTVKNTTGERMEAVKLSPGMQAVYTGLQHKLAVSDISPENAGSWKNNLLVFENTSLEEICLALERKYGVRFTPATPALLHCQYSTRFDGLTLQQAMDKLSLLGNLHFSRKDSTITISGTPCIP
ncbi:FecR family protein [Chitinophaga solisilvae]|uniref:FecR family protein n=1 Tax=Chitinophaga solisilvae TaxID=1233460 RepID=UPI00136FAAAE|nr:FecR family protein [Chitinophaga solisilvae]